MRLKFLLISSIIILCSLCRTQAQTTGGQEVFPFAGISRDAKGAAMGFTGKADCSSPAWSALSSSASLPFYEGTFQVKTLYQSWGRKDFGGSFFGGGAAVKIGKNLGLAIAGLYQGWKSYNTVNEFNVPTGRVKPADYQFGIGAGYRFLEKYSTGANLKYYRSEAGEHNTYSNLAADIFIMGRFGDFGVTAGVSDIGGKVKSYSGDSFSLPTAAVAATTYTKELTPFLSVAGSLDLNCYFSGNLTAGIGAEVGLWDIGFIRGGYHYGTDKAILPSFGTLGLGFEYFGFILEGAIIFGNDIIGNSITASLGYKF